MTQLVSLNCKASASCWLKDSISTAKLADEVEVDVEDDDGFCWSGTDLTIMVPYAPGFE